jgi:tricarballylate dehydrogenase
MTTVYPPIVADTLESLAAQLGIDTEGLCTTVRQYNAAIIDGTYDVSRLDSCRTEGLELPKSHWALRIDEPPFHGYPLRPGITFTYLAVAIDQDARVLMTDDRVYDNVYAAGEIVAGNILTHGYLAGFGMTIGTVSGHIAGKQAAAHA